MLSQELRAHEDPEAALCAACQQRPSSLAATTLHQQTHGLPQTHPKSVESISRVKECALQFFTRSGARPFSSVMPTISENTTSSPAAGAGG
jgi:hypothetical protein